MLGLGAFRPTAPLFGGLLWKIPWRLSRPQKLRHRRRLRRVDTVVATLERALVRNGLAKGEAESTTAAAAAANANAKPKGAAKKGKKEAELSLVRKGLSTHAIERWKTEMPSEAEMVPKDKYTIFDRKVRGYRKTIRKLPKWTRVSQRINPPGF
ncbi:mitochondrial ribosomal protein L31-domain-containing protein [Lineolata rhizophorae]|uniref:Mitochondrial ribosomal protein L31-domain-containing protein n=1 Tax=Lineolata rhizophorae TaxID=578093 RepID=A0A6A6NR14_9PEZI|nr:mitochondrial ribosomal protein L31-domain-containing protein [Lineolata rhizophorae]